MNSIKSLDELAHQLNPLSVKEAARIYGESPSNFYKKIRRGEIPGVYRNKRSPRARIKICPREFVAWLTEQIVGWRGSQTQSNDTGTPAVGGEGQQLGSHTHVVVIQRKEDRIA